MNELQTPTKIKTKIKMTKKKGVLVILGLWLIFSSGYIARDQWIEFQNRQILAAYQSGVTDTVRTLMERAELCQPVSLVDGDKQMELIKVGCVQE